MPPSCLPTRTSRTAAVSSRGIPPWRPTWSRAHTRATGISNRTGANSGGSLACGCRSASVVLRPDAIRERLLRLEDVSSRLEELGRLDGTQLRERFRDAWAVERGLPLAAEIGFEVGNP